ncbi:MAG: DNA-processing protein DprA [Bdellovibrionales bacterium]|nr:DNA-processing protein DprA [Bdellovibrionales bacterium]
MNESYAFMFCLSRHQKFYSFQDEFLSFLRKQKEFIFKVTLEFIQEKDQSLISEICSSVRYKEMLKTKGNYSCLVYGEEKFPDEFYFLKDPPLIFSYLGSECWLNTSKLTVVGSRNPTEKSIHWLSYELTQAICENSWVTVSGGAIGIDQMAHHLSIRAKKPTIAILPSGISKIYPLSFARIVNDILKNGGCLISEFFPFEDVKKYHFQFRNRLIAALNQKCIVIEAKEKSGSLITGHYVLEMGKSLLVLPGHPLDPNFKGSHQLIKYGAAIITSSQDLNDNLI